MRHAWRLLLLWMSVWIVGCGGGGSSNPAPSGSGGAGSGGTGPGITLVSLSSSPAQLTLAKGTSGQVKIIAALSNGLTGDVSANVTYAVSAPGVASVQGGLVQARNVGNTSVTASVLGVSTTFQVHVTDAELLSIQVDGPTLSLPKGSVQPYTATGRFSDNTSQDLSRQVAWSSAPAGVVSVDATGKVTALQPGPTQLRATLQGVSGTLPLTVTQATLSSLQLTPLSAAVAAGTSQQFHLFGTYSDGSQLDLTSAALWSTDSPSLAVNNEGLATGLTVSTGGKIQATFAGQTTSSRLDVTAATLASIVLEPVDLVLAAGTSQTYKAIGIFSDQTQQDLTHQVTWSTDSAAASIDALGLLQAVQPGKSTVTARHPGTGVSASTRVTVTAASLTSLAITPLNSSLAIGTTRTLRLIASFSDGSQQDLTSAALWTSAAPASVLMQSPGVVRGLGVASSVRISAAYGGLTGLGNVTVTAATLQALTIVPSAASLPVGLTQQFAVNGTFSDGSQQVLSTGLTWSSSNPSVLTVDTTGQAQGSQQGNSTVTVSSAGLSAEAKVFVTAAVLDHLAISPAQPSVGRLQTVQLQVFGFYSDGTQVPLTAAAVWSSQDTTRATLSNLLESRGRATGLQAGQTNVQASFQGKTATASLVVLKTRVLASKRTGIFSNYETLNPDQSLDGRYLVFASQANPVTGASTTYHFLYRLDLWTGEFRLVSQGNNGELPNADCEKPQVSADGSRVAFTSVSTSLLPGLPGSRQILLADLTNPNTVALRLISQNAAGQPADDRCDAPSISENGTRVAYQSLAKNLIANDLSSNIGQIFVADLGPSGPPVTGRVSEPTGGGTPSNGSNVPALSGDGLKVAYSSAARLIPGVTGTQIWLTTIGNLTDPTTRQTVLVTRNMAGTHSIGNPGICDCDRVGATVAFVSQTRDLTPGVATFSLHAYVADMSSGTPAIRLVDHNAANNAGNGASNDRVSLSADGRFMGFSSSSSDLVPSDTNGFTDIFVADLQPTIPLLWLITRSNSGGDSDDDSFGPNLSGDGNWIAYRSSATNLMADPVFPPAVYQEGNPFRP